MKLFTYCLSMDTGTAPNPYGGVCTLALTKPAIRRVAQEGDWIVGLASGKNSGLKDANRRIVFAMQVSQVMSLEDYDMFCRKNHPDKIPKRPAETYENLVGDCIYEFNVSSEAFLRPSVHDESNLETDLAGKNALLSDHFYYFGAEAPELSPNLYKIIKKGQGHQAEKNQEFLDDFLEFIRAFRLNEMAGAPINKIENWYGAESKAQCAEEDLKGDTIDEKIGGES